MCKVIASSVALLGLFACSLFAAGPLAFQAGGKPGEFTFDTGPLKGRMQVDQKAASMVSLVDGKTGTELTKAAHNLGVFTYYRLLGPNKRYGVLIWEWPKTAKILDDGALQITWPPADDHPLEMTAVFRWIAPDTCEVETTVKPGQDMPGLELFIGSYFNPNTRSYVYLAPSKFTGLGKNELIASDVSPLNEGTYLSFPRDRQAAAGVFDGRWEVGLHPVQWSISKYLAGALAVRKDVKNDISILLMARPQDCPAIYCSYNQTDPIDGVGSHYSTYISLFGRDIKAGESARTVHRMVVQRELAPAKALEIYNAFAQQAR